MLYVDFNWIIINEIYFFMIERLGECEPCAIITVERVVALGPRGVTLDIYCM